MSRKYETANSCIFLIFFTLSSSIFCQFRNSNLSGMLLNCLLNAKHFWIHEKVQSAENFILKQFMCMQIYKDSAMRRGILLSWPHTRRYSFPCFHVAVLRIVDVIKTTLKTCLFKSTILFLTYICIAHRINYSLQAAWDNEEQICRFACEFITS
jgi:hypothetical protein